MEVLDVDIFGSVYRDRRVMITGHTGFKGSWLTLLMKSLGAQVIGFSLPPEPNSHYEALDLSLEDVYADICDRELVAAAIDRYQPEIIFHLAAQPLVRESYRNPFDTWQTNLGGTLNILEAARRAPSVRALVCITTDKVYENNEVGIPFIETDRLGGHDPYSSSKAACELLIDSYNKSFFRSTGAPLTASVRAGNVIGGGDWGAERLIPDAIRAITSGETLIIRNSAAVRPWQHVLDCVFAYAAIGRELLGGNHTFARPWNIGPTDEVQLTVHELLLQLQKHIPRLAWREQSSENMRESSLLSLNCTALQRALGWSGVWNTTVSIEKTAEWYAAHIADNRVTSAEQLHNFVRSAEARGADWIR